MDSLRSRTRARGSRGLAVRFDIQKYSFLRNDGYVHDDGLVDQWPEHVVHFFAYGSDAKVLAFDRQFNPILIEMKRA